MVHLVEKNKIGKWVYVDDSLDFRKMHDLKFDYRGNMFGKMYGDRRNYCIPDDRDHIYAKNWRPYQGPRGGEGWQNTEDPTDIRYQPDAPGPVEALQEYETLSDIPKPRNQQEIEQYIRIVQQDETWKKGEEAFEKSFFEGDNTKTRYSEVRQTEDGDEIVEWDETRVREVHDPAVEQELNDDAASDNPVAVILMGPAGAGKGWWEEKVESGAYGESFDREFTRINSDDTKEYIPEYEGRNSAEVHAEASHLAKNRVFPEALERNHNIMYDTVANTPDATLAMIDEMQDRDYDLRAVFIDTPPENSITNVVSRFEEGGRMVPLDYAYDTTTSSRESFEQVIENVDREKVGVFVNDEFGEPPRVELQGEDVFKYLSFVYGNSSHLYSNGT